MPETQATVIKHDTAKPLVDMSSNTVAASQQAEHLVNLAIDRVLEQLHRDLGLPQNDILIAQLIADPLLRRGYKLQAEAFPMYVEEPEEETAEE